MMTACLGAMSDASKTVPARRARVLREPSNIGSVTRRPAGCADAGRNSLEKKSPDNKVRAATLSRKTKTDTASSSMDSLIRCPARTGLRKNRPTYFSRGAVLSAAPENRISDATRRCPLGRFCEKLGPEASRCSTCKYNDQSLEGHRARMDRPSPLATVKSKGWEHAGTTTLESSGRIWRTTPERGSCASSQRWAISSSGSVGCARLAGEGIAMKSTSRQFLARRQTERRDDGARGKPAGDIGIRQTKVGEAGADKRTIGKCSG